MNNRNLLIGAVIVGAVLLGLWAYNNTNSANTLPALNPTPVTQPLVTEINQIMENPNIFIGKQVTVQGDVSDVLGRNTIVLNTEGALQRGEILVISNNRISDSVADTEGLFNQKQVRVTGTVQQFVLTTYRDTLDQDVQTDIITRFEGQPFIAADTVRVVE